MKTHCIRCSTSWDDGVEDTTLVGFQSLGLCPDCFKQTIIEARRDRQLREGNFDCYGGCKDCWNQLLSLFRNECIHS